MPLRDLGSASELHRRLSCEASAVLPRVDSTSPWASRGSEVHAFLERCNTAGREVAIEEAGIELRPFLAAIDFSKLTLSAGAVASEIALAFDPATGEARELGRNLGRRYKEAGLRVGEEIPCTIDVGSLVGADSVYVGDYKSGWSHGLGTPPADRNPQLMLGALAMCRTHGRSRAIVEIVRIFDDGGVWKDQATFDAFALAEFEQRLVDMVARDRANAEAFDRGEMPRASAGAWCDYCKSRPYCPAVTGLVRQFGAAPSEAGQQIVALLTVENAAEARRRLKMAKKVIEEVEKALKEFARLTPVPLGGGVVYGPKPVPDTEIDGKVAQQILAAEFGPDFAKNATDVECTKAGISRAVRKWIAEHPEEDKRGALGALEKRALAAIEKAGGVKKITSYEIREFTPKAELPARSA